MEGSLEIYGTHWEATQANKEARTLYGPMKQWKPDIDVAERLSSLQRIPDGYNRTRKTRQAQQMKPTNEDSYGCRRLHDKRATC
jgi:hypothetical protein